MNDKKMVNHPGSNIVHPLYASHEILHSLLGFNDFGVNCANSCHFILKFFWFKNVNPAMFLFLIEQGFIDISESVLNTNWDVFLLFVPDLLVAIQNRVQVFDD